MSFNTQPAPIPLAENRRVAATKIEKSKPKKDRAFIKNAGIRPANLRGWYAQNECNSPVLSMTLIPGTE